MSYARSAWLGLLASLAAITIAATPAAAQKKPNVVMLMSDDVGWGDYGVYYGGAALGHPTPNIDRIAKEGAVFTSWYGQASCTAGRASFMTGRIPVRTALSVVVVPGDPNGLDSDTPTIAEFYKKNGYQTYFSGKWHLGDVEKFYPINHGFDEMKQFAAYYPGVYAYSDTAPIAHPWFPKYNKEYWDMYQKVVNMYEWEGTAGKPPVKGNNGAIITLENLADFDVRQTDSAVAYIKQHAKDAKPFFMSVNFMGMHQPTSPNKAFQGKSHLGNYSDKMMEMDANIGRIMDAIRAEAPDTIVIHTADNGAWQDAWPDAGTNPYRGEKGTGFEGAFRVPGIMWSPGRIPAGQVLTEMMSHVRTGPRPCATSFGEHLPRGILPIVHIIPGTRKAPSKSCAFLTAIRIGASIGPRILQDAIVSRVDDDGVRCVSTEMALVMQPSCWHPFPSFCRSSYQGATCPGCFVAVGWCIPMKFTLMKNGLASFTCA